MAVKFVSPFNAIFYQHLPVHHPSHNATDLKHLEESTMPSVIECFAQALTLRPQDWTTVEQIRQQFDHEGHRSSFLTILVLYVMALHDILFLWRRRVVNSQIGSLHTRSMEPLYPLSLYQRAVYQYPPIRNRPTMSTSCQTSSTWWWWTKPPWSLQPVLTLWLPP